MIWDFEVIVAVIGSLGAACLVLWQLGDKGRRRKEIPGRNDGGDTILKDIRQIRNKDDVELR